MHDAAPVLTRASGAGKSLHDALSAPQTREAQAVALEAYAAPLDAAAKQLAKLDAPPVVAPSQRTQIQTYRLIAARARALATALRNGKSGAQEVHDLQVAAATSSSTQAQKARIAAIKAFNRRTAAAPARGGCAARAQPSRADAELKGCPGTVPRTSPTGMSGVWKRLKVGRDRWSAVERGRYDYFWCGPGRRRVVV